MSVVMLILVGVIALDIVWAIVSVLLAIGEIFTPGLFFLGPIALATLAATVTAALGGPIWLQVAVFGAGSFAALGLLRPIARAHLRMPRAIRTGTAALEGAKAIHVCLKSFTKAER